MSEPPADAGDRSPTVHRPVLLREVLSILALEPGLTVLDGTVGAGGHSRKILEQIGTRGTLIGLDRDPMMIQISRKTLTGANCHLKQASYAEIEHILQEFELPHVDRVLLDLGLSSDQLVDETRGFGIDAGGELDFRFDTSSGLPAWKLIEQHDEGELADIIHRFGEERYSKRIAAEIVRRRRKVAIRTATDLEQAVLDALPRRLGRDAGKKASVRVFQALRISVNEELVHLERALETAIPQSLKTGGRAVVISFHSLEDRLVKTAFRDRERWENLTPKPITPTSAEKRVNPRCRSAKLRAAVRK